MVAFQYFFFKSSHLFACPYWEVIASSKHGVHIIVGFLYELSSPEVRGQDCFDDSQIE